MKRGVSIKLKLILQTRYKQKSASYYTKEFRENGFPFIIEWLTFKYHEVATQYIDEANVFVGWLDSGNLIHYIIFRLKYEYPLTNSREV